MDSEKFIYTIEREVVGFEKLWDTLIQLRTGISKNFGKDFILFQERLAEGLENLCRLRGVLCRERKRLLRIPGSKRPKGEVEILDRQINQTDEASSVGLSLGDAYAFFFYQKERELLKQHLSLPKNGPRSDSLGHIFEFKIARQTKMVGGEFAVHHCLTTMLRLGDVTVYDLKSQKVSAIGELKTIKRDGETVTGIGRFVFAKTGRRPPKFGKPPAGQETITLPEELAIRFARQLKQISETFKSQATKTKVRESSLNSQTYGKELTELLRKRGKDQGITETFSESLVVSVMPLRGSTFCDRLNTIERDEHVPFIEQGLPHIRAIVDESSSPENTIVVNTISPSDIDSIVALGFLPLFWRNIAVVELKPLFFYEAACTTFFNPLFLKRRLIGLGLRAFEETSPRDMKFEGELKGMKYQFHGFFLYCELACEHLFTEDSLIKMLAMLRRRAVSLARSKNTAVRLDANIIQVP